jgi:leucyl-tRNA synthetase
MCAKYGADTVRTYMMFAAPPEKDFDWSDKDIEGASRFLAKVFRLVTKHADSLRVVQALSGGASGQSGNSDSRSQISEEERSLLRKAHQTLRHVTEDMEGRWHFNTDVALLMELVNELMEQQSAVENGKVRAEAYKAVLELLVTMLSLFAPHIADELWEELGHAEPLLRVPWPAFERELAAEDELEMPVQVNGKLRARIRVAVSAGEEEILARAQAEEKVIQHLAGKEIVKVVIVPQKLINIVAR